jgi:hypothetical protein
MTLMSKHLFLSNDLLMKLIFVKEEEFLIPKQINIIDEIF